MSSFSHLGYFPFCYKEVDPSEENQRYNDYFLDVGFQGFGSIYPIGMELRDVMALYWRLKSIEWDWSTRVYNQKTTPNPSPPPSDCTFTTEYETYGSILYTVADENSQPKPENIDDPIRKIFLERSCDPLKYTHRLIGKLTYDSFLENTCSEGPPIDRSATVDYYPMSCFFEPLPSFGGSLDPEYDFSRLIYWEGLYYPTMLLSFYGYSRLIINQKFLSEESDFDAEFYGNIPITTEYNTYDVDMLWAYNYTPTSDEFDFELDSITCSYFDA